MFCFLYFNRGSKWAGSACGAWKMATLPPSARLSFIRQTTPNLGWFRRGGPKGVPSMSRRQKELAAGGAAAPVGTRRKKPSCNSSLYSAEVGCWDAKENMLGWGGNQATTRSRSNPRTHPARLLFPKSDHPPHIPQRLGHVSGQERKKMKPTSTQKIQFSLLPIYKRGNAFKCIPAMIRL